MRKQRIEWSAGSLTNLEEIEEYIARENPAVAVKTVLNIVDQVEAVLSVMPSGGRPGRVNGTREFVLTNLPYIVVYTVEHHTVQIIRVFHTSQDFQKIVRRLKDHGSPE